MNKFWMSLICAMGFWAGVVSAPDVSARFTDGHNRQPATAAEFSKWELMHASPFDPEIQRRTFLAVARAMYIKHLDPSISVPHLVVNTTISLEELPEYIGFELDTNRLNYFSYLKNTILLCADAKIHNLAHEMAHYFQFHYQLKGNIHNLCTDPEPEAVRIQHGFRPETKERPMEGLASRSSGSFVASRIK